MESGRRISAVVEGALTPEPNQVPKKLIYTLQQFDQLVLSGQFLSEDLLGCQTTALTRVIQDFNGNHMDKKEWVQLFPKKTRTLGVGRFKRKFGGYYVNPIYLIRENRSLYGSSAGFMDTLSDLYPELATDPRTFGSNYKSFYTSKEYDEVEKQASDKQGVQLVYGGEGFIDFLDQQNQKQDPEWFGASVIDTRVPSYFITAVIPLGPYEQQTLTP